MEINKINTIGIGVFIVLIASCLPLSCNSPTENRVNKLEVDSVKSEVYDTIAIKSKFIKAFLLSDSGYFELHKVVKGDESGKYSLLIEMKGIRSQINKWNDIIKSLKYVGDDNLFYAPTYVGDSEDHAWASAHVNKLLLQYGECVEKLFEEDYKPVGVFYSAHFDDKIYWLIEDSTGVIIKKWKNK